MSKLSNLEAVKAELLDELLRRKGSIMGAEEAAEVVAEELVYQSCRNCIHWLTGEEDREAASVAPCEITRCDHCQANLHFPGEHGCAEWIEKE